MFDFDVKLILQSIWLILCHFSVFRRHHVNEVQNCIKECKKNVIFVHSAIAQEKINFISSRIINY